MADDRAPAGMVRRYATWAGLLVLPLVLGALVAPGVLSSLRGGTPPAQAQRPPEGPTTEQIEAALKAQEALAKAQRGWATSETIAPRDPVRDASGELTSPFQGFGLSVETTPPGASVLVDGRDLGETPLVAGVDCRPGDQLEISVERRGYRPHRQVVRCRADTLLTIPITLRR